jgi:hypothetical protein
MSVTAPSLQNLCADDDKAETVHPLFLYHGLLKKFLFSSS